MRYFKYDVISKARKFRLHPSRLSLLTLEFLPEECNNLSSPERCISITRDANLRSVPHHLIPGNGRLLRQLTQTTFVTE